MIAIDEILSQFLQDGCDMPDSNRTVSPPEETDAFRFRRLLTPDALSVSLVSALAGDRPLTDQEDCTIRDLQAKRGDRYFSDLLYAVTHQFFPPVVAGNLWQDILQHKVEMSQAMHRNVRITVATLDYLSNLKGEMQLPTLISEGRIAEIADLSLHDGLTGLFNQTSCREILDLELQGYLRYGKVVSLIFLDIDSFKQINDRYGHQEGDRILVELAAAIRIATRAPDICCRYGGDEFVVILPFTDTSEAGVIAERIRIAAQRIFAGGIAISVSCGVTVCSKETATSHALIDKADQGLYQAKHGGTNRVEVVA